MRTHRAIAPERRIAVNLSEAAAMLGVSPDTLTREIAAGNLPYTRVANMKRILIKDIDAYLSRRYVPAKRAGR